MWILFVFVFSANSPISSGVGVASAEFTSKKQCEDAGVKISSMVKAKTVCVWSGD